MLNTWSKFLRIKLEQSRGSTSFILSCPHFIAKSPMLDAAYTCSVNMFCDSDQRTFPLIIVSCKDKPYFQFSLLP